MHSTTQLWALAASIIGADPAPPATGPAPLTMWQFAVRGGPTIIVIALCSLVALAVIVERLIVTRRRAVLPPQFIPGLRAVAADRARTIEFARSNHSPIAAILTAAIQRRGDTRESVERAVSEAGRRELVRLRHRMRLLGALPQVATMLGLLGTILGMIKTFQAVASSGQSLGKTELLARGIFEAWANTAAGLLVAIPVLIAYHMILGRIDARAVELDRAATDWIEQDRIEPVSVPRASEPALAPAVISHANSTPAALVGAHS